MDRIVKQNLLLSSTPEALRGLSEEALGLPVKICSRTSSFHGLHAGFGWEKALAIGLLVLGMAVLSSRLNA